MTELHKTLAETDAGSEIWHCLSEPDRELANTLVGCLGAKVWYQLARHFDKPYPYTVAEKYDLVYRLLGCKK